MEVGALYCFVLPRCSLWHNFDVPLLWAVCRQSYRWINSNLTVSYSWICAYTGQCERSMILVCLLNECWVNNNDTAFLLFLALPLWDFSVIFLPLISLHHDSRAVFIKVLKYNALRSHLTQTLLTLSQAARSLHLLASTPSCLFFVFPCYELRTWKCSFLSFALPLFSPMRRTAEKMCRRS